MNMDAALVSIYDSAMAPDLWEKALDECVTAVGSHSASLAFEDNFFDEVSLWTRFGGGLRHLDPKIISHYFQNLAHHELPVFEHIDTAPCRTLFQDNIDTWPYPDEILLQRADYAFLYHRVGILRRVATRLNDSPAWSDRLAFQFPAQMTEVPTPSLATIRSLIPHMAKAVELGRSFTLLRARYKAALAALDCVETGICVALGDGTLLLKNDQATRMFSDADGMTISRANRIVLASVEESRQLQNAIAELSRTARGQGRAVEFMCSVKRRSGLTDYLLEVSPLRDSLSELDTELSGALIMIIDTNETSCADVRRLALAFSLTSAETEVAHLLVDGWTMDQIAEQRNVSPQTIKTQSSSILHKTGARKRSDLIRLALRLSPPIRTPS